MNSIATRLLAGALFVLTSSVPSFAQEFEINGNVSLEDGSPVSKASVVIENLEEKMLGYCLTEESGSFHLAIKTDGRTKLRLIVTGFNLERLVTDIDSRSQTISLKVKYKEIKIKEAKIKSNPIKKEGDTLAYYVSMFADTLDRSIGDVLKKMPGISVDKTGGIRYQGVLIDKFYIEGMELMGNRYGVATNNVRAKDIAVVEVYENHQPIKMLQSLPVNPLGNGKVAVNLKLKEKAKGTFIGTGQAGVGYKPFLWEAGLVGMVFSKNYQFLFSAKSNNDGVDIISELDEQFSGLEWLSPLMEVYSPQSPDIGLERYMRNATLAVSANSLFKLDADKVLSVNGTYYHDVQKSENSSVTQYYIPSSSPLTIIEQASMHETTDNMGVRVQYTDNSLNHYIKEACSVGLEWNGAQGEVQNQDKLVSQSFDMSPNKSISNQFEYSSSAENGNSIGIKTDLSLNDLPARLKVSPNLYPELFGYEQNQGGTIQQTYAVKSLQASVIPYYLFSNGPNLNVRAGLGTEFAIRKMNSRLGKIEADLMDDDFRNDNNYRRWDIVSSIWLGYRKRALTLSATMDLSYAFLKEKDFVRDSSFGDSKLFFNPALYASYKFSTKLELIYQMFFNEDFVGFEDNYEGYIMTDYRSFHRKNGTPSINKELNNTLEIKYSNPLSSFFASGTIQYWNKWSDTMYGMDFIGNLSQIQLYKINNHSKGYSVGGKTSKYFSDIATTFEIKANWQQYWMQIMRTGDLVSTDTRNPSIGIKFISNIGRKVKTEYNCDYSYFLTSYDKDDLSTITINSLKQKLSAEYAIIPRLVLKASGEHYFNSAVLQTSRNMFFLDATITFKTKVCDYCIEARNLLDTQYYNTSKNFEGVSYQNSTLLRPRAILLKAIFSIK